MVVSLLLYLDSSPFTLRNFKQRNLWKENIWNAMFLLYALYLITFHACILRQSFGINNGKILQRCRNLKNYHLPFLQRSPFKLSNIKQREFTDKSRQCYDPLPFPRTFKYYSGEFPYEN